MNPQALLSALSEQVEQNLRLRLGVYLILVLVLAWCCLVISEHNQELELKYQQAFSAYQDLASIGDATEWQTRYEAQSKLHAELLTKLWRAPSENQILASIQSSIRKLAKESKVDGYSVTIGTPQWYDESTGIKQVRSRIRARFASDEALLLVALVEDATPLLRVENLRLDIDTVRRANANTMSMDVLAYYQAEAEL